MKMNQTILTSALAAGLTLLTGSALAQEAEEGPAEELEEEAAEEEELAQAEEEAPEAEPEPEPEMAPEPVAEEPEPMEEPAEEPVAVAVEKEVAVEVEEEEEEAGGASLFVFADAYAAFQTAKSGRPGGGGVYSSVGPTGNAESGFGINWLGLDLGYDGGKWGLTGSIRAGDGVYQYGVGTLGAGGVGITNAYATWKPVDGLAIDLGIFGTIYGAEVAESWANLNYTRGELYFNYQPFWHTGLRVEYAPGNFVVRALLVNDPNSSTLEDGAINGGLQAGYDNGTFGIVVGALQTFNPEASARYSGFLDTFFDAVLTVNAGGFSLVGNFDLNVGYETADFWGASLAAGYAFTDAFGLALRGEYLSSTDELLPGGANSLVTGTLTIDTKPTGDENFVVRWDNRIEVAGEDGYINLANDDVTSTWFSSTLGVVAYADLL